MLTEFPFGEFTLDDLDRLPDDGHRYEIVDGSLIVSPPPTPWHQDVAGAVQQALTRAAPTEFTVHPGGAGIALRDNRSLIPDIIIVRAGAGRRGTKFYDPADVILVVEVVSPSNPMHDLVTKRALYSAHGIDHYWIADSREASSLTVLRRHDDVYEETLTASTGPMEVIEPFTVRIDVDALFGA